MQTTNELLSVTPEISSPEPQTLRYCVTRALNYYFSQLSENLPQNLYDLVLAEVEAPLLEVALEKTYGNQSQAAIMLGISRGTLRKLLKQYNLL